MYKYNIGDRVRTKATITATGEIVNRKEVEPDLNLYQVKIIEHDKYNGVEAWFVEHEIDKY